MLQKKQLGMTFSSIKKFRKADTKYAIQKRVQVEKYVNESTRVWVKCCKENYKWLLYASIDSESNNFVIGIYHSVYVCEKATKNYPCDTKFVAKVMKDDVIEQPNIKVFKLQDLIRKKYKVHIGKTTIKCI